MQGGCVGWAWLLIHQPVTRGSTAESSEQSRLSAAARAVLQQLAYSIDSSMSAAGV